MTDRRSKLTAGLAALTLGGALTGCSIARTGTVSTGTPQVVTVLPLVYGATTRLIFDPATAAVLKGSGLTLAPTGTAVADGFGGAGVDFPITTGYAELHTRNTVVDFAGNGSPGSTAPADVQPGWVQGSIAHFGSGLTITGSAAGSGSAPSLSITDLVIDPGHSVVYGTVGDTLPQVPVFHLDGSHVQLGQDAGGAVGGTYPDVQGNITLSGIEVTLDPALASTLTERFPDSGIDASAPLGTLSIGMTGQPYTYMPSSDQVTAFSRLTGQGTTLAVDQDTASALSSLGVHVAAEGSATGSGSSFTFPITGGAVAVHSNKGFRPGYVVGSVLHQGSGLSFTGPNGASVNVGNFVVDPGGSELYADVNGKADVPLLFLDGSKLTVSAAGSTVTLDGTVAELTSAAATTLDDTFGVRAFKAGMPLGTVHLVATGQPGN